LVFREIICFESGKKVREKMSQKVKVDVVDGDITKIGADAIIAPTNSEGIYMGAIDRAIQGVASDLYHGQLDVEMEGRGDSAVPFQNLQVFTATGERFRHGGEFDNIIFVVDDVKNPVDEVVYIGLTAAHILGYSKVLIPAIRMGVAFGIVEKTLEETAYGLVYAVRRFVLNFDSSTKVNEVVFVVHHNEKILNELRRLAVRQGIISS